MNKSLFFSCENISIISASFLYLYPNIEHILKPYNISSGYLFFLTKEPASRYNFNTLKILAFANVRMLTHEVRIVHFESLQSNMYVNKIKILQYISNIFSLPIAIEIDITRNLYQTDLDFFSTLGFNKHTSSKSKHNIVILRLDTPFKTIKTIHQPRNVSICNQTVIFPKTLANHLSEYLKKPHEIGGKICISRIEKRSEQDVLILSISEDEILKGPDTTYVVTIPDDLVAPFSFHTHPDIAYEKVGTYIGWPSGEDIVYIIYQYFNYKNILAHFVVTVEGIWVVHIKPLFQEALLLMRNEFSTECKTELMNAIFNKFNSFIIFRQKEIIPSIKRSNTLKEFINVSNNLKISDIQREISCSISFEDSKLFNFDLIKWKEFKSDYRMHFAYVTDAAGGLPCNLDTNCPIGALKPTEEEPMEEDGF